VKPDSIVYGADPLNPPSLRDFEVNSSPELGVRGGSVRAWLNLITCVYTVGFYPRGNS
jgi:hypothetical protein